MTAVEDLLRKQSHKRTDETETREKDVQEAEDAPLSPHVQQEIDALIESNEVVVFSKSYCPYCRQAKMALRSISGLDFVVVEMDDGQHDGWQARIAELAKSKAVPEAARNNTMSVPQIFIKQLYIGGAEDLADMYVDKRLATMLGRASL
jgi:glutaredoxin 3